MVIEFKHKNRPHIAHVSIATFLTLGALSDTGAHLLIAGRFSSLYRQLFFFSSFL